MFSQLSLTQLAPGEKAEVAGLYAQGAMRRRFQDLGVIPGTVIECLGKSPLGDPSAYLIRGAVIALRGSDARSITIGTPFRTPAASPAMLAAE